MLTPDERRGAATLLILLLTGAGWDLWRAAHPGSSRPPASIAVPGAIPGVMPGLEAPPPEPVVAPPSPSGAAPVGVRVVVDLNRAGPAELEALPGIGPVLARRICEQRTREGPFRSLEELRAVRGVGPRLLERLRGLVAVGPLP